MQHAGIPAHQDAKATQAMVQAQFAKNLHISDGFGELEAKDRSDEDEMKQEFKVYDPVAAVPTNDLKPRLRKSVELHDIFAKLEVEDAPVYRSLGGDAPVYRGFAAAPSGNGTTDRAASACSTTTCRRSSSCARSSRRAS